ncbi:hypothetical protein SAMN05421640_1666 [Ekhidna lutea]|uniref:Uncharacterized protein n=1 Tax=Ekhidna lutea TaxID=447679 RepID=A0A239IGZ3_EKHLU|nr:hypothetical protein [Ekhidna lutea]SNS92930.1 hypothetical protein SAMN05421640_1666 [Ekhidna lutea]
MRQKILILTLTLFAVIAVTAKDPGMKKGTPNITSISVLEFNKDGILFIGDSKGGAIYAVDLDDDEMSSNEEQLSIPDLEDKIAGMLGTTADNVMIHDMAVNPISQNVYLSVSRGRAKWTSKWETPNDITDASILIRISPSGKISEASLEDVEYSSVKIPNPVDASIEHRWKKGAKLRSDAITDIAIDGDKLYITGLSNEEFRSALWTASFPFTDNVNASTLEIFHGAHGKWETASPVRAFLPYELNNQKQMLAAYLCTPLVTIDATKLTAGNHVKGRTVAEFGSGNYPIDMVLYQNNGKDYILMSNSALPLLLFDPQDVANYDGEITEEVQGYLAGVKYTPRSGNGVQQLADFNKKYILSTQRLPNGKLALTSLSKDWLYP